MPWTKNRSLMAMSLNVASGLSERDLTGKSEQPWTLGVQSASSPLRMLVTDREACRNRRNRWSNSGDLDLISSKREEKCWSSLAMMSGGASLMRNRSWKNVLRWEYWLESAGIKVRYAGPFQTTPCMLYHCLSDRMSACSLNAVLLMY